MRQALEGSQALARAVGLCRPQVVAAYPITPQTHIVENISKLVADGEFETEFVSVESEFSAASTALGAVLAGSRAYTASSSQGLLLMSEVLFNIAGLRVPLVLTCANRALGAPLNIWNDQSDSMAVRDSGWIQLYCADNQEAVDTTIQAYRIAEQCELPVMVCVDGFTLTHTLEPIDIPEQGLVDGFLPPFRFSRRLDPQRPLSLGTLVTPDHFTEVRHSHQRAMEQALGVIAATDAEWAERSGRPCGGLLEQSGPADATIGVLTLGSIHGTLAAAMALPDGEPARLIKLRCFRPLPVAALRAACAGLTELVVVERAFSAGAGGIVANEIRAALFGIEGAPRVHGVAVGLGGRDVPLATWPRLLAEAHRPEPEWFRILDADLDKLPPEER